MERSCVRREVENITLQAFEYVENRLIGLATRFKNQGKDSGLNQEIKDGACTSE